MRELSWMDGISGKLGSRHCVKIKVGNWHTKRKSGGCGVQLAGCRVRDLFMGTGNEVRILVLIQKICMKHCERHWILFICSTPQLLSYLWLILIGSFIFYAGHPDVWLNSDLLCSRLAYATVYLTSALGYLIHLSNHGNGTLDFFPLHPPQLVSICSSHCYSTYSPSTHSK